MQLDDLVRVIGDSPFFSGLPQEEQLVLAQLGRVDQHMPGRVLFRPGQVVTALYLVIDGVVEICREESEEVGLQPVAYLGSGALLAGSKVITGTVLNSQARFPEGGTTLQWPRATLLRQLYASRDFALHYLQSLARRLEGTIVHLGARSASNLGGMLDHFDLPAILQTVVDSGATGVLEVRDSDGHIFGSIHTRNKMMGPMLCGTLAGPEAFMEILNSPPAKGTFRFSTVGTPRETEAYHHVQPLLFEAVRIQDEFQHFASEVPEDSVLRTSARQAAVLEDEDAALVEQIWQVLEAQPCGWGQLAERLPYSRGQVGLAVRDMLRTGLIVVDGNHDPGDLQGAESGH
jgi:CRP-like cAMP-binding protein